MSVPKFSPGARVRLTGKFLRNTGNFTGPDSRGKWLVQACACSLCSHDPARWTAVNERNIDDTGPRHFATGNLQAIR
jgi:hypothetical protein